MSSIQPYDLISEHHSHFQRLLIYFRMKYLQIFNTTTAPQVFPLPDAIWPFRYIHQVFSFFHFGKGWLLHAFSGALLL